MSDPHTRNKTALAPLRAAMVDFDEAGVRTALGALISPSAVVHMPHPLGDMKGADALYETRYDLPLRGHGRSRTARLDRHGRAR